MSKEIANIHAQLQAEQDAIKNQVSGIGGEGLQRITAKNRTFIFPDGGLQVKNNLDVVILASAFAYQYYDTAYDPKATEKSPPVCAAVGLTAHDLRPSPGSPKKQAETCALCPQNQFGSGVGDAKACQNRIQLAVQIAEHGPDSNIFVVSVSPSALKNWRSYATALTERNHVPVQVVTRLGFDPNVEYVRLTFAAVSKLDNDALTAFFANTNRARQMLLREPSTSSDGA